MDKRGMVAYEMGRTFNLDFLSNLNFWFALGAIGGPIMQALTASTGTEVGKVEPRFAWIWVVSGAGFGSLVIVVKWLMQIEILKKNNRIEELERLLGEKHGN